MSRPDPFSATTTSERCISLEYTSLTVDTSIDGGIPKCFDDASFKKVKRNVYFGNGKKPSDYADHDAEARLRITFHTTENDNDEPNHDGCLKALQALVQSNYFQTHAKQIIHLELEMFSLDDWQPFLETFAKYQSRLKSLTLLKCNLTEQGACSLGLVIGNNEGGIQIEYLDLEKVRGSNVWIPWLLSGNITIKRITTTDLDCGFVFIEFLKRCCLDKFDLIEYNGLMDDNPSSMHKVTIRIVPGGGVYAWDDDWENPSVYLEQSYSWGSFFLEVEAPDRDCDDDLLWKTFQHLLIFQGDRPTMSRVCLCDLKCFNFSLQLVAAASDTLRLGVFDCYLTESNAKYLGFLLNTGASKMNIESLKLSMVDGSNAWIPGFYKNESIQTLHLQGFDFWHSFLHFLRNTRVVHLKKITLSFLFEEQNKKPLGTAATPGTASIANAANIVEEPCKYLTSLETFLFEDFEDDRECLPKNICVSLGNVLRSIQVKSLNFKRLNLNPQYDFLKDGFSCI